MLYFSGYAVKINKIFERKIVNIFLAITRKIVNIFLAITRQVGSNRKHYQQSTTTDKKSIETVFLIAICRQCGDKWQSKTLFLMIFYQRSSIVLAFSIAAYPVCISFNGFVVLKRTVT